ncbi:MAG: cytochrome b N-terminal domain-containing protein [bacterium]|nr:cytochrome b N-terminal domain-containing protein [bacterium]
MVDAAKAPKPGALSRWRKKMTSSRAWRSVMRHGYPDNDLDRMQAVVTNFFLHIMPARVNVHTLRPTATFGLGVIALFLFFILVITGVLLMFYYVPSVDRAYHDMKDLQFVVSYGIILRNMHRWAAHGMVAAVFIHMCRVFYTGSYKPPREFNWVLGVILWVMTMFLSFTGYLLPWDQLAFWAITVGSSIAAYPPLMGDTIRFMLLGGQEVGQGALLRFYVLHVAILPIALSLVLAVHLWRVRKDGGLARPREGSGAGSPTTAADSGKWDTGKTYGLMALARGTTPMVEAQAPEEEVTAWPHLIFRLFVIFMATLSVITLVSLLFDAPLEGIANPTHPPNPSKAPWYFLGLQELVSYSALMGGVVVPGLALLGLILIPYIDYSPQGEGVWFTSSGREKRLAWQSALSGAVSVPVLMVANAWFGIRILWAESPQLMVDVFNPATVLLVGLMIFSSTVVRRTGSRRLGAVALFSAYLGALVVLTIIGTFFRGANWAFVLPWASSGGGH